MIIAFGVGLTLVFAHVQDEKLKFGYLSLLFLFLVTSFVGSTAAERAGKVTVQISGGRDPEYETETVRDVSASTRFHLQEKYDNAAFALFPLSAALGALILVALNRGGPTNDKRLLEIRGAGVTVMILVWLVLSRALEG